VILVLEVFVVKLELFGPCTRYVNGPLPLAVAVRFVAGSPAHTTTPVSPAVGLGLTVTTAVANELLQPSTEVTRFEYVPPPAPVGTVMLVLDVFVVKLKLLGPFTRYVNGAFPLAVAVRFVAGSPAHTVVPVSPAVGSGLIVTAAVTSALLQPLTEVTKFEYVPAPAPVGTVMLVLDVFVVKLKLLGPFTKYVNGPFPLAVAVRFVVAAPEQTVTPVNPAVGNGLTVTTAVANALLQPSTEVTRFE